MKSKRTNCWLIVSLGLWLVCAPMAQAGTYEDLLQAAAAQVQQRQFADAVETLKVAIRAAPNRYEGFAMMGLMFHGAQQSKEAQEAVTEALKRVPTADRAKLDGIVAKVFPNGAPVVASLVSGNSTSGALPQASTWEPWKNSLGMKFVPVPGTEVLFCIWHTRVQDFEAFVKATEYDATADMISQRADGMKRRGDTWRSPGIAQGPTHPVCGLNWDDAKAFADWLTEKERKEGKLKAGQSYRLPQDWEWSVAVGLNEARAGLPSEKHKGIAGVYPWGTEWPPLAGAGNFAGEESKDDDWPPKLEVIPGYRDGYPRTSPVGSFSPNKFGLYDMSGNLWQWCEDWFNGDQKVRVVRGGSWDLGYQAYLLSSFRHAYRPDARYDRNGFRVVLVAGRTQIAGSGEPEETFAGRITSLDPNRRTLIVSGDGERRLTATDESKMRKDGKPATVGSLAIGDQVTAKLKQLPDGAFEIVTLTIGEKKAVKKKAKDQ